MSCPPEDGLPPSGPPGNHPAAADSELARGGVALVSLGCYCGVKLSFRKLGAGAATLPLDWMRTRIEKVIEFLQTDFSTLYDGLSGPIAVPCTNLLAFRGDGHSFWHDDIRQPETKSKLQRRIDRLLGIGQTSSTTLFVRALATTDELSQVDALHAELVRRFGSDVNRVFLLAIVCRQERTVGPMVASSSPGLLLYCLSGKVHDKEGGEPAPFCEPISWALQHIGGESCRGPRGIPSAAFLLEQDLVDLDTMGLEGMNGIASFETPSGDFSVGSRVEASYKGRWYLATVLAPPEVAWGNLWKVHCDVDPKDVSLTTTQVRAVCA
jgi:hypothetical protein